MVIPKQEYTTEFKERAVKHVNEWKSSGLSAKEAGLEEQPLPNRVKLSASCKLTDARAKPVTQDKWIFPATCLTSRSLNTLSCIPASGSFASSSSKKERLIVRTSPLED